MHITDWLEMLGEHFPLVVIGCAEALLAVVLLCAALRNRRQSRLVLPRRRPRMCSAADASCLPRTTRSTR